MRTAIIVVSYNGRAWLESSLGSCRKFAPQSTVYVVDNNSTDGSADFVSGNFPEVVLLRERHNLGFAGGNNVGLRRALADGAEALFLLNQDAELTLGCLGKLEAYLAAHPRVAAVQPGIFLANGLVNSFGNSYHYLGFGESGGNGLTEAEAVRTLPWLTAGTEPAYLSGAAMLVRSEALRQVGLFDDALFMYHEDLELSLRLRLAGWHLALERGARVTHHYDHKRSLGQLYYMERNRFIVWLSYLKAPTLITLSLPVLAAEILMLIAAAFNGWLGPKLRAYAYFFTPGAWRTVATRRRQVALLRKVSDRHLLQYASPVIAARSAGSGTLHTLANTVSSAGWKILQPIIRW